MNTNLRFFLHFNERRLYSNSDEFPLLKRILEKMGLKQKLNRSKKMRGIAHMGRCSYNPRRVEIYLDEINKFKDKEKEVIDTIVHEYLHLVMYECFGDHKEEWIDYMTEEALR